jgi:hypothetical protein
MLATFDPLSVLLTVSYLLVYAPEWRSFGHELFVFDSEFLDLGQIWYVQCVAVTVR